MNATGKLTMAMMAAAVLLSCGNADAQHWRRHWHSWPHRTVTIVTRPAVTAHVSNRFTQKERFNMAMAYLKNHDYLTVQKYAKMTELSKATAQAELDAFATDKDKPIEAAAKGRKKVYILRKI